MKRSVVAALLSGLVLPGLGQMVVFKRWLRGLLFMAPSGAALLWIMRGMVIGATDLLDQAASGRAPMDPVAMAEQMSASGGAGVGMASLVLLVCWIASIADALLTRE
ncbi:hypothetical protein ACHMW6_18995 [Pseudoduganella sp. UC29_106]|uniref:hypothetical protein n=1 Tax=Pseudoduganella sp. UC29_106 TaxID=3374553 RepID=UPI00375667D0